MPDAVWLLPVRSNGITIRCVISKRLLRVSQLFYCVMPPMKCSVADSGVLASIFKMQKKVLAIQSKMMRRVLNLEVHLSERSTIAPEVKCDKWICPVCLHGFF
jgi:hypothetical protein